MSTSLVRAQLDGLSQAAVRIETLRGSEAREAMAELRVLERRLLGAWSGAASEAFGSAHGSWLSSFDLRFNDLNRISRWLGSVAEGYRQAEAALLGKSWSAETLRSVLPILRTEFAPISDVRGTAEYRSGLITSLLEKFFACDRGADSLVRLDLNKARLAAKAVRAPPHESAHKHVTGEAVYTDDIAAPRGTLAAVIGYAPAAHAGLRNVDLAAVRAAPGVVAVVRRRPAQPASLRLFPRAPPGHGG